MPLRDLTGHLKICEGEIAWADEAAHGLLGYPRGTLAGRPFDQVLMQPGASSAVENDMRVPAVGAIDYRLISLRAWQDRSVLVDMRGERMDDKSVLWTFTLVARGMRGERLHLLSQHDALTRLPNRIVPPEAPRNLPSAQHNTRGGSLVAVCYLDLDRFRDINDSFGMAGGDAALLEVARRLKKALPPEATVARVGGDEFAVVVPSTSQPQWNAVLERIVAGLTEPYALQGQSACLHASMGVALLRQGEQPTEIMLRAAQQAAFLAKRAGGNQVHFFDARQAQDEQQLVQMRQRIREGLAQGEFVLAYQPKVDMRRGLVIGVEALIRWQHPERGLLLPAEFVPFIEDHELVERLGDWVIAEAVQQTAHWLEQGVATTMSVNISARHMLRPDFMGYLASHLKRFPRLPAGVLELEILETSAIKDFCAFSRFLQACKELGVPVTLDDFGTGYSSLAYLRRLPVVALKLDQSFVRGMLDDAEDLAIVKGIVLLAKALGRRTIAEGVESVAHGHALMALGCTLGQGYGIAKPLPAHQVPAWIAEFERSPLWGRGQPR